MRVGEYYIRTFKNSNYKFIYKIISCKEGICDVMIVHNDLLSSESPTKIPYMRKLRKDEIKYDKRINKMEAYLEVI
jgi:hypothetical protein